MSRAFKISIPEECGISAIYDAAAIAVGKTPPASNMIAGASWFPKISSTPTVRTWSRRVRRTASGHIGCFLAPR